MKLLKYAIGIVLLTLLLVLGFTQLSDTGQLAEALTAYFWGAYVVSWRRW